MKPDKNCRETSFRIEMPIFFEILQIGSVQIIKPLSLDYHYVTKWIYFQTILFLNHFIIITYGNSNEHRRCS